MDKHSNRQYEEERRLNDYPWRDEGDRLVTVWILAVSITFSAIAIQYVYDWI